MKIVTPVVVIPEPGETIFDVASKIYVAIQSGQIGSEEICLRLPLDSKYPEESGRMIEISGNSVEQIRDSIARQTVRSGF